MVVFAGFLVPTRPAPTVHVSMPIAAIVNHGFLVHKLCSLLEKSVAKDERVPSSASSIDVTGQGARAEGGERGKGGKGFSTTTNIEIGAAPWPTSKSKIGY